MNPSNVTLAGSLSEHLLNFRLHFEHGGEIGGAADHLPEHERLRHLGEPRRPRQADESEFDHSREIHQWDVQTRQASAGALDKADAIRVVGDYVTSELEGARILDVGCGVGYLSSWYAAYKPGTQVLGLELSASRIMLARQFALAQQIRNLRFEVCDARHFVPDAPFDTIVDTQGMVGPEIGPADIRRVMSWLKPGGKFICVPALGTLAQFVDFLDKLEAAMCRIAKLRWLEFSAGNGRGVFPAMIIAPDASE